MDKVDHAKVNRESHTLKTFSIEKMYNQKLSSSEMARYHAKSIYSLGPDIMVDYYGI